MELPDHANVRSQKDFVRWVSRLRRSLDFALSMPEPPPYINERGGWINWNARAAFTEAMVAWLGNKPLTPQEVDEWAAFDPGARPRLTELHSIWPPGVPRIHALEHEPISEILLSHDLSPPNEGDLAEHLAAVESWALEPRPTASARMWRRAAAAMALGAVYE